VRQEISFKFIDPWGIEAYWELSEKLNLTIFIERTLRSFNRILAAISHEVTESTVAMLSCPLENGECPNKWDRLFPGFCGMTWDDICTTCHKVAVTTDSLLEETRE